METLWFWLVAIIIAGYVLLDGFDLGAGALHLFLAKTDEERTQILDSIGQQLKRVAGRPLKKEEARAIYQEFEAVFPKYTYLER